MASYKIGDLITFTYPAVHQQGTKAHDKFPQVLVLHDGWADTDEEGKKGQLLVHGLNFNYLTTEEQHFVRAVLNPDYLKEIEKKFPSVAQRVRAVNTSLQITSPKQFYDSFIKGFIRPKQYDPYRKYVPSKMSSVKVLIKKEIITGEQKEGLFSRYLKKLQFGRGPRIRR